MKLSLLINMKMPTIVGIFIFISRENYMLSCVEHEKSFITSRIGVFSSLKIYVSLQQCMSVTGSSTINSSKCLQCCSADYCNQAGCGDQGKF